MTYLTEIECATWTTSFHDRLQAQAVSAIEAGGILIFPQLPFGLLPHESEFLSPVFADPKAKNISFNPHTRLLQCAVCSQDKQYHLQRMLQRFSEAAECLVKKLLAPYAYALQLGRTSFRPVEIAGRVSSYRKDDTRLHIDAFPATPNQGQRILRVFTNINPHAQNRHWRVGEHFLKVAKRFLPLVNPPWLGKPLLLKALQITKGYRTTYDHIMLQIHDKMKADLAYQKNVEQTEIRFAPGTSWIVQTDHVSHAAMSGQHALEQTFYLPVTAMKQPELSPLRVLEKLTGKNLI
jgi:hypothetical protein